ncbi:MAG: pantetheine-phosphate adenylyltransferase [Bacteroidales bacterium]|nr:pantetheine-phosphate adenylyltransferase [Bacteroidales bacterium]
MSAIAVYAGSFSPFTKGHEDIVRKSLPLFDRLIIAIGHNYNKKDLFSVEQRVEWIRQLYKDNPKVTVDAYQGLTVDLCRKFDAQYLIRGIRNAADYAVEEEMRLANRLLCPEVETLFIPASPEWAAVSSSLVRELWSLGSDAYRAFVPDGIDLGDPR